MLFFFAAPRSYYTINFNDLMMSSLSLFVVMVGNNWNQVVDAYTVVSSANARWYFVMWCKFG